MIYEMLELSKKYYESKKTIEIGSSVYGLSIFTDFYGNTVKRFQYFLYSMPKI